MAFWQKRTRSDESYGTTGLCDADYLDNAELAIKVESNFEFAEQCVNAIGEIDDSDSSLSGNIETKKAYIIDFNWFMAIIVGLVTLWLLLSYCLNAGIRIVQLTLLQILSPVAIIGYLSPKDETTFTKWLKIYFSTYIDVFIRLAILNFIAYIMALIFEDSDGVFWHSLGLDTSNDLAVKGFITVIICLALLSFAKKAPELLQKIFPTGESGLNLGFEKASSFAPAGMAAGIGLSTLGTSAVEAASRFKTQLKEHPEKGLRSAFAASLGGLGSGMRHGFVDGFKKGNPLKNSYNAWKAGQARGNQYHELVKNGGSAWGQTKERLKDIAGQSTGALDDELVERSEQVEKSLSGLLDNAKGTSGYKMFDERIKTASLNNQWDLVSKLQDAQDQYLQDFVEKSLKGEITKDSKLSYDITATEAVTYDKDVFDENGTLVHGKGENILDKNGNVQYRTVSQTVSTVTTGGDLIKSGSIQSGYAEIKEYVDQVKPKTMDSNGNISQTAITLPAAKDANMGTIKGTIGQAQTTIQNVKGRSGYRAGQANKPNNKNN